MGSRIMVGNRLKLIRQANALSLQDLADLLSDSELSVGKGAISHYEMGITTPSKEAIKVLAKKLGTTEAFFDRPDWDNIDFTLFTPHDNYTVKYETQMLSFVQIQLEKYLYVESLLNSNIRVPLPQKTLIHRYEHDKVDEIANNLRKEYDLGSAPISSVSNTLEHAGWKTIELEEMSHYVSGYEKTSQTPFLIYPSLFAVDDFRFSLLSSVGYAYIEGEDKMETDTLVERFARAMLLPKKQVAVEFGFGRGSVSISELTLTKQKYGISKRQVMRRLLELGVISKEYFDSFEDLLRLHGFPRRKQILAETVMFFENPVTVPMKVLEAQSRGLISKEEVDSLLLIKHMT